MTLNILTPPITGKSGQYHLSETHRQEILAKSDSSRLRLEIERQRLEFIRSHGDVFGMDCAERDELSHHSLSSSS